MTNKETKEYLTFVLLNFTDVDEAVEQIMWWFEKDAK